jgi:hypothetical protein
MSLLSIDTLCGACLAQSTMQMQPDLASSWETLYPCANCKEHKVRRVWSFPRINWVWNVTIFLGQGAGNNESP